MEALQMLKFSIKKGRRLDFTAGISREAELALMESDMAETGLVPEDTTGFNTFLQTLLDTQYDSE
ncbi:hypothetical protein C8R45DRAFT_841346 [Mycena sanguinolenta]|nr:hypothetical protein C8R45DRAFT_841346 [Mycena sanguinolenta]